MLRNDVEDITLRGALEKVDIGFKDDDAVYLVCEAPVYLKMLERKLDVIQNLLEKAMGKTFALRTTIEAEFESWYQDVYGKTEETAEDDTEFASLMEMYFPDADIE